MNVARVGLSLLALGIPLATSAQQISEPSYSRRNTYSGFFEYSNDSSHIILGEAENRKIGAIGFQYQRRLIHRGLLDLSYTAEVRPGMMESDPTQIVTFIQTSPTYLVDSLSPLAVGQCHSITYPPITSTVPNPPGPPVVYTQQTVVTCSRRTVFAQGFSPAGARINLMPRHRLQATFSSFAGYMFSTEPVPVPSAGSFNFTFEFGGGLEFYRTHTQSMRLEYQVQHFSNKYTDDANPGVDSSLIKLTYTFGR